MANSRKFSMFDSIRLSFSELKADITQYISSVYDSNGAEMSAASPFMQILYVVAHLGRMILFYIESAMNETNILTAVHDRSVYGLATLTGHNPSTGMAARGAIKFSYTRDTEYLGEIVTVANYTSITNSLTGLKYMIITNGDSFKYTVGETDVELSFPIIQGSFKYQTATATGMPLQSYSFSGDVKDTIDNYYINVFVNGVHWKTTESFIDLSLNEQACVIRRNGANGIDVYFGDYANGAIPENGAIIAIEYLVCNASSGNIAGMVGEDAAAWSFNDDGMLSSGETVDLNKIFTITSATDILFGTESESVEITRLLAPHTSRSFVLANKTNYEYFLRRLNMFSTIDVIQGFNTFEDKEAQLKYDIAEKNYISAREDYVAQVKLTGQKSKKAREKYDILMTRSDEMETAKNILENSRLDDNIIYLMLIPKLSTRIDETSNYFTCNSDAFLLTDSEKESIIDLIDNSGQKIITVDNQIIDPKTPRFAINVFVRIWDDYNFDSVKSAIIEAVSNYLLENTRRDRIPVSDLIRIVEDVNGVDSVSIYFDADKNNESLYGKGNYGIDDFGDIILSRSITDTLGNKIELNDLYPLFRGPFVSKNNVEYSDNINSISSPINIQLIGTTSTDITSKMRIIK